MFRLLLLELSEAELLSVELLSEEDVDDELVVEFESVSEVFVTVTGLDMLSGKVTILLFVIVISLSSLLSFVGNSPQELIK